MGLWVVSKKKFDVVKLRTLLQNTISRKIISSALMVEDDGRFRFEHMLDDYVNGKKESFCISRNHYSILLKSLH